MPCGVRASSLVIHNRILHVFGRTWKPRFRRSRIGTTLNCGQSPGETTPERCVSMRKNAQCWWSVTTFAAGSIHVDSTFSTMSTYYSAVPAKEASELRQAGWLQAGNHAASSCREDHGAAVGVRSRPCNLCSCRVARDSCEALKLCRVRIIIPIDPRWHLRN